MIKAIHFETLFRENYKDLSIKSKIIWWKYNELGYNDNIYTSDDLLHDLFFSLNTSVTNKSIIKFNDLDHFIAFCYIRMKSLYMMYLKKKWNRNKLERLYFRDLGYTYEKSDIFNSIFDYELNDNHFLKSICKDELISYINMIKNDTQKRILLLKMKDVTNEKICDYFNFKRNELRNKLRCARKKLFKILHSKGIIKLDVKFKDFVGISSESGILRRKVNNKKYLYNNYPFELSYKDKIKFIINKNRGKIDLDILHEVLKFNEGYQLKKDLRTPINYALEQVLSDNTCFILDGIIYMRK